MTTLSSHPATLLLPHPLVLEPVGDLHVAQLAGGRQNPLLGWGLRGEYGLSWGIFRVKVQIVDFY